MASAAAASLAFSAASFSYFSFSEPCPSVVSPSPSSLLVARPQVGSQRRVPLLELVAQGQGSHQIAKLQLLQLQVVQAHFKGLLRGLWLSV